MSSNQPEFLQEAVQTVWRLASRVVVGVGQLLLWVLTGVGRLMRPVTRRVVSALSGTPLPPGTLGQPGDLSRTTLMPRWLLTWHDFTRSGGYAPATGALLTVAALVEVPLHGLPLVSLASGFAVAATAPLMWRRESLRPVAAIVLSALSASLLSGQPLLLTTAFAGLYTLYLLAQQLPRQSSGVLGVTSAGAVIVVHLAAHSLDDIPWPASVIAVVGAVGLGNARRVAETAERSRGEAQEQTTETLSRLDAVRREQAVLRERARIARDLHDIVAHSVSMIAVQAETAPYTMGGLSAEAKHGFAEIAGSAREALVEMRRLLDVLRADAKAEPEVTPQPKLDRLPELIAQHRSAGGRVDLSVHGEPRALSTTVELSAYRIVQEALTNTRRHAAGARARVELSYLPDRLAVRIIDDGPGVPPGASKIEGGHGLVGMRERATMLGGRFSAGSGAGGGFAVEAELPVSREEIPRNDPSAHRR